jgi:AAA+ superfamily predicted ATPase
MPSGYLDRAVAARFTHRALTAPGCDIRTVRTIVEWLYEQEEEFELGLPPSLEKLVKRRDKKSARASSHAFGQAYGADRDAILSGLENAAVLPPGSDDPLSDNLELLKWDLGLGEIELGILEIAARYTRVRPFEALCDRLTEGGVPRALACLLGTSRRVVQEAILPNGSLVRCGVIWVNTEERYIGGSSGYLEITEIIDFNLDRSFEHFDDLRQAILGAPQKANLGWEDFAHLGREGELLSRVLKGAIGRRTKGINILLYGPPGGGKTELCKTLAADLGLTLLSAGETDGSWNEKGRNARLSDLLLAQRMLRRRDNVALMFDEMEDLPVRPWQRDCRSKLFINRLLESNRTPVLWISNTIDWIDPAVLRRMTLVVEIKVPGPHARVRLWTRMLRGCAVKVSEQDLASLARETETAPGILSGALTAAELADGGLDELEMAIRGVAKAVNHGRPLPPSRCAETGFEPTLARSDHDLVRLTARLQSSTARAFSLCLSGPSGTGKSAYARHLGAALGLACVQKRASDLLDKWVGESEKAIARAFEEAHDNEALLIFDEADSLLSDRRQARNSWEITQVNEMLTWMESHPLPFCCTTNLADRLDPASLRRFTFNVVFDYLDRQGLALACRTFFGTAFEGRPSFLGAVLAFQNLTPGDFAMVRRKATLLGCADDPAELAKMLGAASVAKPGQSAAIGFSARGLPAIRSKI